MIKESRVYILSAILNFSINYRFDTHTCKFVFDSDNDNAQPCFSRWMLWV